MNIAIVGLGKFGLLLTEHLSKENHDIVVIDTNAKIIEEVVNQYDVKGYVGNGASYVTQKGASITRADLLIATTSTDEVNILTCLVAKKIGIKQTIARIRNPEYSLQAQMMQNELGISMTVNPDYNTAMEIFRTIRYPSAIKVDSFANGKVDLVEIKLEGNSPLIGKSLLHVKDKYQIKILVCAVKRDEEVIIPHGDFILNKGDYVYITAETHEMSKAFKKLKFSTEKVKSVMLIGGSRLSYYLSEMLIDNGVSVKIIENNRKVCDSLSDSLPKALILNGDGTNQKLLLQEGLENVDALVTLTGLDETNIIVSTYAKNLKCKKVITKVSNGNYDLIFKNVGLDSIISPRELFASNIIRYVRGMQSSRGSEFKTLYRLVNNKIEASEFVISKASKKLTSIPLKDLHMKKNILLACIIRENQVIIPSGKDTLEPLDSVIIISANDVINDVKDILE